MVMCLANCFHICTYLLPAAPRTNALSPPLGEEHFSRLHSLDCVGMAAAEIPAKCRLHPSVRRVREGKGKGRYV
ncbi:hypothetical protein BZA05DRAFT_407216 [Tricharina praecox]|uniref:uncharacterized protein n=1 Tax=Tricharina praecox TaxID=43433 RepID=UPI00221EF0C6|nr:uncharacterized protein BZA05DRAFT_407216 [Tricharina praecox]KAI5846203.1 hypothetical protein BZA05DRAFT_407216 [Tricharina praecox]